MKIDSEKNYYPIFVTGPLVDVKSDRRAALFYLAKKLKFKYFTPDDLRGLVKKKSKISFLAEHCIRNTYKFESILSQISLANIMFPHTGSSIYELGQFNSNYSNRSYIYIPNKDSKLPSLGEYIEMNHFRDYVFYKNKNYFFEFPKMDKKWKYKNFNALSKTLENIETKFSIREITSKSSIIKTQSPWKIKDSEIINFGVRASFPFINSLLRENGATLCSNIKKFKKSLREHIGSIYNKDVQNIALDWNDVGIEKTTVYTLSLVSWIINNNIPSPGLVNKTNQTRSFRTAKGRIVTTYASTRKGDIFRQRHSTMLSYLDKFEEHPASFAYSSDPNKNWVTNASLHRNSNLYDGFILKTDIENFFESMDLKKLNIKLEKFGIEVDDEDVKQGLKITPKLSNIYMKSFDEKISKFCFENNLLYSRYSDDITISTPKGSKIIASEEGVQNFVFKCLADENLKMNKNKTEILSLRGDVFRIKVTGIVISRSEIKISKRHMDKLYMWGKNPVKYGLTKKYVANYKKLLDENSVRYEKV